MLRSGQRVIAVDKDAALLKEFDESTYTSKEPGIDALLKPAFADGRLALSGNYTAMAKAQAVI
ncbi:MAG: UDP-glucose 6-dehydrogenase, partial [Sphingobacteriales bacterium]